MHAAHTGAKGPSLLLPDGGAAERPGPQPGRREELVDYPDVRPVIPV